MMNRLSCRPFHTALLLALAGACTAAHASGFRLGAEDDSFRDQARVVSSQPTIERVNVPRQVCRLVTVPGEPRPVDGPSDGGGAVIGGITGGLIGSQFGRGEGRVASAAVGAIAGTLIGQNLSGRPRGNAYGHDREVQRCHFVDEWEQRVTGYQVSYEYLGRVYSTRLPQDPGPYVTVRITVQPVWGGPHRH